MISFKIILWQLLAMMLIPKNSEIWREYFLWHPLYVQWFEFYLYVRICICIRTSLKATNMRAMYFISHYRHFFKPAYFLAHRTQDFGQFWQFCRKFTLFLAYFYRPELCVLEMTNIRRWSTHLSCWERARIWIRSFFDCFCGTYPCQLHIHNHAYL